VKRKSKERSIFCCESALPKNPKASPGERKMHPPQKKKKKRSWKTLNSNCALALPQPVTVIIVDD